MVALVMAKPLNIKQLRERAELGAEEAAFKLNVALSTLRNWEAGKTQPTMNPEQYANLLEVYKCTFEEFRIAAKKTIEDAAKKTNK